MRNVLIIGHNSFIGSAVANTLRKHGDYKVSEFDILGIDPEIIDFGNYDTVIMAAGIEPTLKADKHPEDYYKINRDMAYHTAVVAKAYGVQQFIVLSTLDVYGIKQVSVTAESTPAPETDYAKSKYESDQKIAAIESDDFRVCIVRLPVVYSSEKSSIAAKVINLLSGVPKRRAEKIHIEQVCSLINQIVAARANGITIAVE